MPQLCENIAEPNVNNAPVITRSGQRLEKLSIFVGFDSREELAYEVCRHSLLKHATVEIEIIPLKLPNLTKQGIYTRPRDATESTEFSFTRFLTPSLAGFQGWAMFVDCDFLYTADVRELAEFIDEQYAIMCVHHNYTPKATVKMDGVLQTSYPRKNWSSMVLYNCAHPKNKLLTPELVNSASGAFLHRFMWLEDADIGELPFTWNFLVGHNEVSAEESTIPKAIHFTSGGPWFEAWKDCEFGEVWLKERDEYWNTQRAQSVVGHHELVTIAATSLTTIPTKNRPESWRLLTCSLLANDGCGIFHIISLRDEMMWNISHRSVRGKAISFTAIEYYEDPFCTLLNHLSFQSFGGAIMFSFIVTSYIVIEKLEESLET